MIIGTLLLILIAYLVIRMRRKRMYVARVYDCHNIPRELIGGARCYASKRKAVWYFRRCAELAPYWGDPYMDIDMERHCKKVPKRWLR